MYENKVHNTSERDTILRGTCRLDIQDTRQQNLFPKSRHKVIRFAAWKTKQRGEKAAGKYSGII